MNLVKVTSKDVIMFKRVKITINTPRATRKMESSKEKKNLQKILK